LTARKFTSGIIFGKNLKFKEGSGAPQLSGTLCNFLDLNALRPLNTTDNRQIENKL
jgi:hypothetical protein